MNYQFLIEGVKKIKEREYLLLPLLLYVTYSPFVMTFVLIKKVILPFCPYLIYIICFLVLLVDQVYRFKTHLLSKIK